MLRVYKKKNFEIYGYKGAYIIYNKNKPFETGHSHIKKYKTAKYLIDLAIYKTVPKHLSSYLYESLLRISSDNIYKQKIRRKMDEEILRKKIKE